MGDGVGVVGFGVVAVDDPLEGCAVGNIDVYVDVDNCCWLIRTIASNIGLVAPAGRWRRRVYMTTRQSIDEKALNGFIAQAMEKMAPPHYEVGPEIHGQATLDNTTPDIVVRMPYDLRMIVETEYGAPAVGDAISRLGYDFADHTRDVKNVIALGIPSRLGERMRHVDREAELMSDSPQFLMQVVTGRSPDDPEIVITPPNPIPVSLRDVVQYAWLAAIPESYAADVLSNVVANLRTARNELTRLLEADGESEDALIAQNALGFRYGNPDSESPTASAAGNIVGTLVSMIELHRNLNKWGHLTGVRPIDSPQLWSTATGEGIPSKIAVEWRKIEQVDYKPLSTIAAEMLEDQELSPKIGRALKAVHDTIEEHFEAGLSATTNVAAAVWQELTPDRDERAVNYTRPHRAEMLANMTSSRLERPAEARYAEVCAGTGTLARATEENIRFRHYADSSDKTSVHATRMENRIQLTDISQQSVSVATANLTSLEPESGFRHSNIFAITTSGGALDFLSPEGVTSVGSRLVGSFGEESGMLVLDPRSVGICCNNDPYFRSRGGASNPISSREMSRYKRLADRKLPGVANGDAGLATHMHVIEHEMLAHGAPHGKVLPLTAAHAETYEGFRRNIEDSYRDVIAISTAAGSGESMSDDTKKQEMLLIGTKTADGDGDRSVVCVNLVDDFSTKIEAKMFADAIARTVAEAEHSGDIVVGNVVGTYERMTDLGTGSPWYLLGTSGDYTTLTGFVNDGVAWDPATDSRTRFALPIARLDQVANIGPTHHLIGCIPNSRSPSGAFWMERAGETANRLNPALWAGDSPSITCVPTHYGRPRSNGADTEDVVDSASNFHIRRNLRQSSNSIAAAYTEQACFGGSSWTSISGSDGVGEAICLFLNSTYGMLIRFGHGQSQDRGRSRLQVGGIKNHPIPDFGSSSEAGRHARHIALENFDRLRYLALKRMSLSATDPNRAEIDEVVTKMLGLDWNLATENMLDTWRRLMCQQANVHNETRATLEELREAGVIE